MTRQKSGKHQPGLFGGITISHCHKMEIITHTIPPKSSSNTEVPDSSTTYDSIADRKDGLKNEE
jgi:hypothetical protein